MIAFLYQSASCFNGKPPPPGVVQLSSEIDFSSANTFLGRSHNVEYNVSSSLPPFYDGVEWRNVANLICWLITWESSVTG